MTPQQYCEQKLRHSGSSFYYSFLFLSDHQKQAMTALYAFCREIDDVVDQARELSVAAAKLNWWKDEIERCYEHRAAHPIALALAENLKHYRWQKQHFIEMINGMEMDLHHQPFQTIDQLERYCYHAAATVGLLTIEVTGYQRSNIDAMQQFAIHLGTALQIINILRDIKEDSCRKRIYIPREMLQQYGLTPVSLNQHPQARPLFQDLAELALKHYHQALQKLPAEERYQQRVALVMAAIYLAVIKKIQRQHYPVMQYRVSLSPLKKLWLAWTTILKEQRLEKQRKN